MQNENSFENKLNDALKKEKDKKQAEKKSKEKARINEIRRKYFDYYDDVKTNIKEDW